MTKEKYEEVAKKECHVLNLFLLYKKPGYYKENRHRLVKFIKNMDELSEIYDMENQVKNDDNR